MKIKQTFDPSLSVQRSIDLYRFKGYDEKWIAKIIQNIQDRKELTDISEEVTKRLAKKTKPKGLENNLKVAHAGGKIVKNARDEIETNNIILIFILTVLLYI